MVVTNKSKYSSSGQLVIINRKHTAKNIKQYIPIFTEYSCRIDNLSPARVAPRCAPLRRVAHRCAALRTVAPRCAPLRRVAHRGAALRTVAHFSLGQ